MESLTADVCFFILTFRWVFEDLPMLRDVMHEDLSQFSVNGDLKNYHSMKNLCDKYNGALKRTLALVSLISCYDDKTLDVAFVESETRQNLSICSIFTQLFSSDNHFYSNS